MVLAAGHLVPEYGVGRDILVFKVNVDGVQEWDTGPNATFELIISAVSVIQTTDGGNVLLYRR